MVKRQRQPLKCVQTQSLGSDQRERQGREPLKCIQTQSGP